MSWNKLQKATVVTKSRYWLEVVFSSFALYTNCVRDVMADYGVREEASSSVMLQNVRALLGEIASRAEACEDARVVPVENIRALRDAGFLGGFKPAQYGGGELTPRTMFQAAAEIATVCESPAWVAQLLAVHSHAIASYDPRLQEEIWAADPARQE